MDDTKIVSASEDNKIRVWNFIPNTARQRKAEKLKKDISKFYWDVIWLAREVLVLLQRLYYFMFIILVS